MEFLAGIMAGIVIGGVAGLFAADAIMRNQPARHALQPTARELLEMYVATQPQQVLGYQPPVIVLAAPREQPHTTAVTRY
mgnify:CR=1 FL=1